MANNYIEFAEEFPYPDGVRKDDVRAWFESMDNHIDLSGVELHGTADGLLVMDDAGDGDVERAIDVVRSYWARYNVDAVGKFHWIERCDKHRAGEFAGGCVVFDKEHALWLGPKSQQDGLMRRLQVKRGERLRKPTGREVVDFLRAVQQAEPWDRPRLAEKAEELLVKYGENP